MDAKCYHMLLGMLIIYLYTESYTVGADHVLLILPGGRGSRLVRDGLRSCPKTGHLGCIWCTEAAGFAVGSRQFADKSAPTYGRSRKSRKQAKRRPVRKHNALLPAGRGSGLVRDGLRSGPETGHLDCVWCTVCAGFTAGSRQFADKRSVARFVHSLRPESKADGCMTISAALV